MINSAGLWLISRYTQSIPRRFISKSIAREQLGAPLHQKSLHVIRRLRQHLGSQTAIIGVGGILSGQDAVEKLQAGAQAVQLYTGLIYRGPALVAECVKAIASD